MSRTNLAIVAIVSDVSAVSMTMFVPMLVGMFVAMVSMSISMSVVSILILTLILSRHQESEKGPVCLQSNN